MQTVERNIYLNFTKSIVDGFDEFVTGVEKQASIIADDELRLKLKHIGKTLQTIFNKWENTTDKKSASSSSEAAAATVFQNETNGKIEVVEKTDTCDDFDAMIASLVGATETMTKVTTAEVASTSRKSEFSILDIPLTPPKKKVDIPITPPKKETESPEPTPPPLPNTATLTRKEAELVRKFKIENVKEEWIRGSKGLYIVQSSPGSWKCNLCKKEALSYANIITHASGKTHIKKIGIYSRETSQTRGENDTSLAPDLSSNVSDVESELLKKINCADMIVPFSGFYCNACRGTLKSEEDIKLHVIGGKHRKKL